MTSGQSKNPAGRGASLYGKQWDQFYAALDNSRTGEALWDVQPEAAVARDYQLFSPYLEPSLPIIDFGCGTGRQTAHLAQLYSQAIGLDVSSRAITRARQSYQDEGARFHEINEADRNYFANLSASLGDTHIYMRGVLHQIQEQDVIQFISFLQLLMGSRGKLFLIEVANNIREYLSSESKGFSRLPGAMKKTLISRLPPRGISLSGLPALFPRKQFNILCKGESWLQTNITFDGEKSIQIPAVYAIVEPASR